MKKIVAMLAFVLLFVAVAIIAGVALRRADPRVVLINNAEAPLTDIRFVTIDSSTPAVHTLSVLDPGQAFEVTGKSADLFVGQLSARLGDTAVTHSGGIATPREVFVVSVLPTGEVNTHYRGSQPRDAAERLGGGASQTSADP